MASAAITNTIFQPNNNSIDCQNKLRNKQRVFLHKLTPELDSYDAVLVGDPSFLKPIRKVEKTCGFQTPIHWKNALLIITFHLLTLYLIFNIFWFEWNQIKWQTLFFSYLTGQLAGFGVTAGAHRYWCHRSFKAKLPLQLILAFCFSVAGQNTIYDWVRDHRVHHKYSETSADPHNANRGFFFSHVGWLMMKKHPDVIKQGAKIDMTDIKNDPVVKFHTKYFLLFKISFCWVIPTLISVYLCNDSWKTAIICHVFIRYMLSLNFTWSVNSFAHLWGNKPYDRFIMPAENVGVSIVAMGEGWHNYHHTFPWDYKASELGTYVNITTGLLNVFAHIGWAYDLKQASPALIRAVVKRKGQISNNVKH